MSNRRPRASSRSPRTDAPPRSPAPDPAPTGLAAPLRPARIAGYLGLAVLGALVALAGTLVQAAWFPGGLLLALAACAGLFYGGRLLVGTQFGALAPAAGWFVAVVVLLSGRPEGDYVFAEALGLALFLLGGMIVAVMCATTSRLPRSAANTVRPGP